MKIIRWLSPQLNAVGVTALIRVEQNEIADPEEMLKLVDGDSVGHFGYNLKIVKTGEGDPIIKNSFWQGKKIQGYFEAQEQFGYSNASKMKEDVRYYSFHLSRD